MIFVDSIISLFPTDTFTNEHRTNQKDHKTAKLELHLQAWRIAWSIGGKEHKKSQQGSRNGKRAFSLARSAATRKLSNLLWHYYCVIRSSVVVLKLTLRALFSIRGLHLFAHQHQRAWKQRRAFWHWKREFNVLGDDWAKRVEFKVRKKKAPRDRRLCLCDDQEREQAANKTLKRRQKSTNPSSLRISRARALDLEENKYYDQRWLCECCEASREEMLFSPSMRKWI